MFRLNDKRALVTGARHGIGAATARILAASGATVAVCGRRPGDCMDVVAQINCEGGVAFDHALDVSAICAVKERMDQAITRLGGLDILVNNAAMIEPMARLEWLDPLDFDQATRVNLTGAASTVSAAWPTLKNGGRIVNVLSGAAVRPMTGWAAYCSTKAGLLMLTRCIDLEGAGVGIRSFGLAPGLVDTDMQAAIRTAKINEISDLPQESLICASEPAKVIAWIASGNADSFAGTMIDVRDPRIKDAMAESIS